MDLNGKSEIVTGPGPGGSPNVRVFNGGNATLLSSFFAFDQQFSGGVTVGLTDVNYDGFEDIVAAAGPGGAPEVSIWNSASTELSSFFAYNAAFQGGVFASGSVRIPVQLNNTYIDPTVQFIHPSNVELGGAVLIAPFVVLDATNGPITIGDDSDLQDNVRIVSSGDGVTIGDRVIIAHGASIFGSAQIGKAGGLPTFVGFNSIIDGAILEEDSMVLHLAKVAPGITIHSGTAVKSGKF